MKFPWNKYKELPLSRRNTLQIYITNRCNLKCRVCFARNAIKEKNSDMDMDEYENIVENLVCCGGEQVNLLGGEPLLHPYLKNMISINSKLGLKTTIYTNGRLLFDRTRNITQNAKIRVSIDSNEKHFSNLPKVDIKFDANFMVGSATNIFDLIQCAKHIDENYNCDTFFISSYRELDNPNKEFFDDTDLTMPVIHYKKLIHDFMYQYDGNMDIHVSKRGVFESTTTLPDNKCRFANYFIGGKIIQCPYDVVNLKYQKGFSFGSRYCQHNNSCLMSKVKYRSIH